MNDEENDDFSENVDENEDDEMVSDEEVEDDSENENNLNNDMSDLKEDMSSSDEERNTSTTNTDKNKSTKLFAKKLKEKKVLMDEARQQLPYTFIGNIYFIKCYISFAHHLFTFPKISYTICVSSIDHCLHICLPAQNYHAFIF